MATRKGINWIAIRTAYVVKGLTAQQCANTFKVDVTTVKKRASKEGWTAERHRNTTHGGEVVAERMREAVDAEIAANGDAAVATVVDQLDTLARGARIANKLAIAAEMLLDKYLAGELEIDGVKIQVPGITPGEKQNEADVLNAIADAVKKTALVGREIGGLKTGESSAPADNGKPGQKKFIFEKAENPAAVAS